MEKNGFRSAAAAAVRFLWERGSEEKGKEGGGGRKQYPLHSASVHSFDYCEFLVQIKKGTLSLSIDNTGSSSVHFVKSASFSLSSPCSDSPFLHTSCIPKLLPASVHVTIFEFRYPPFLPSLFNPLSSPVTQFCTKNLGERRCPIAPPFSLPLWYIIVLHFGHASNYSSGPLSLLPPRSP